MYSTQDKKVIDSREALISIFKSINDKLRDAGIKAGLERMNFLSNMLFLKVISELYEIQDTIVNLPPKDYLWNNFKNKKGLDLLDFLNKQAFDHFKQNYGGEVLSKIEVLSGKEHILNTIIDKLDNLWLSDTNTDIKGDAFEFFLRNYGGAETDFGEYFTPRHIVKTLVKLLKPCFGERVYDPFCGTGGMLIESFKHIKRKMPQNDGTIQTLKASTVYGGEITPMYRIAKMNMILAGDGHSNIKRQDSYETRITNEYDVVITNIPFGSKMKTDYLGNYGFQGTSAEIAGVLHCLDAMKDAENARAGILIPEGILFNGNKAYTALREKLIEQHEVETIVSLPQGVFTDAGVKSNILLVKKKQNKQKKHLWYFNVKSDGYSLDKARRPIEENDLNTLFAEHDVSLEALERLEKVGFQIMHKENLRNNKHILLPSRYYKSVSEQTAKWRMVALGDFIIENEKSKIKVKDAKECSQSLYPFFTCGESKLSYKTHLIDGENLYLSTGGKAHVHYYQGQASYSADTWCITTDKEYCIPYYLYSILKNNIKSIDKDYFVGTGLKHLQKKDFRNYKIPLPPLEEQKAIVRELESYQKVIDGARQVVENYAPHFEIDKQWEMITLGELCKIFNGGTPDTNTPEYWNGQINWATIVDTKKQYLYDTKRKISEKGLNNSSAQVLPINTILFSSRATIGEVCIAKVKTATNQGYKNLVIKDKKILYYEYLYYILLQKKEDIENLGSGGTYKEISKEQITHYQIPVPSLCIQEKIVEQLEKEEECIKGCKTLIKQMKEKIQNKINSLYKQ